MPNLIAFVPIGFMVLFFGVIVFIIVRAVRAGGQARKRDEALFVSMFPDLQPYFHPERLVSFVRAQRTGRRGAVTSSTGTIWKNPPGLGVPVLEIDPGNMRVPYRMRDESGALLGQFLYDTHAEGGVLRVGKGKLTVITLDAVPRVRYWHPQREFKWSQTKGWKFVTPVADYSTYGNDSDSSSSSSSFSSSSDSSDSRAPVGGGGTFDGGGASGGWDDSSSSGSGTSTSTSY